MYLLNFFKCIQLNREMIEAVNITGTQNVILGDFLTDSHTQHTHAYMHT